MKKLILTSVLLFSQLVFAGAKEVKNVSIDNSLLASLPKENQIYYGWKLFSWNDWLRRPSSGPLMIPGDYSKKSLEVFEAHSAGIVKKPVSTFTKAYLHNINTIRKLDPQNKHEQLSGAAFTTETLVAFPANWAKIIYAAKNAKILADDTVPYLQMKSVFAYADEQSITNSAQVQRIINLLDDNSGQMPSAVNIQGIVKANQIAEFGSVVTLFYDLGGNKTLIVNYFALALKKRILDLGVGQFELTGRGVLLGQNSALNTESGIGAGLPTYTLEFFEQMLAGL